MKDIKNITSNSRIYEHLQEIFMRGVERVKPYNIIKNSIRLDGNILIIKGNKNSYRFNLEEFQSVIVIGTGKATASMAKAVEEILGGKISEGLISVKYGYTEDLGIIKQIEAGHPIPDKSSLKAAKQIFNIIKNANEKTLIINLISGGGSALLSYPFEGTIVGRTDGKTDSIKIAITLEELQKTTEFLLESGATIDEINCIRKHISMIKGGRLARVAYPALQINLILSDVVGDRLDSIASGLTAWDTTTYIDAYNILVKYNLSDRIPENVLKVIKAGIEGKIEETVKKGDIIFSRVNNFIIGSNYDALLAAKKRATELGYNSIILTSRVTGESKEIAKFYSAIAVDLANRKTVSHLPACIISGGETTVTIKGNGKGGRNQEMVLSFLITILKAPEDFENVYFLAASTDGGDGPTDAAGAFASLEVLEASKNLGLNPEEYLEKNDSYNFFNKLGFLFKTGPTNTNVCDIHIIIVG